MGDKYSEIENMIEAIQQYSYMLPHEEQSAKYMRAVAMIRTKLDEARLWTREARLLEIKPSGDYP